MGAAGYERGLGVGEHSQREMLAPFQLWGWVGKGITEVRNSWLIALLKESRDSVFSQGKMAQTSGIPQLLSPPKLLNHKKNYKD